VSDQRPRPRQAEKGFDSAFDGVDAATAAAAEVELTPSEKEARTHTLEDQQEFLQKHADVAAINDQYLSTMPAAPTEAPTLGTFAKIGGGADAVPVEPALSSTKKVRYDGVLQKYGYGTPDKSTTSAVVDPVVDLDDPIDPRNHQHDVDGTFL
jgi:hypothetical protein